jgi:hypothetical protein
MGRSQRLPSRGFTAYVRTKISARDRTSIPEVANLALHHCTRSLSRVRNPAMGNCPPRRARRSRCVSGNPQLPFYVNRASDATEPYFHTSMLSHACVGVFLATCCSDRTWGPRTAAGLRPKQWRWQMA